MTTSDSTWAPGAWTPHRRGDVYCSQACGASCTHAAFELATERARALATQLGPAWEPRVHENMGWFYRAVSRGGRVFVTGNHYGGGEEISYSCFVGPEENGPGGRWTGHSNDPHEAVKIALDRARKEMREIQAAVASVIAEVGES